jgi:ABC-type transporter Mla subunit MlaD
MRRAGTRSAFVLMENLLIIFIVVTSLAVLIQAGVLVALFLSFKKTNDRLKPVIESASALLVESRPKLQTITDNLEATTTSLRSQVERLDATMSDVIDRTRLQVIRADELVGRALDRVEETSELVQHSVISPVKQLAGLISGLTVGLDSFFRRGRRRPDSEGVPEDEELFI